MNEKPRTDDPADPVTGTPEEVAASEPAMDPDPTGTVDPNEKADTTKDASVEPTD